MYILLRFRLQRNHKYMYVCNFPKRDDLNYDNYLNLLLKFPTFMKIIDHILFLVYL